MVCKPISSMQTYSMENDVKWTVPRWRPHLWAWNGRIGHLYISVLGILWLLNCSKSHFTSIFLLHLSKTSINHMHTEMLSYSRQPFKIKVCSKHSARIILGYYYLVECMWCYCLKKIITLSFFNEQSHSFFHVLILILNPLYLPKK